MSASVGIAKLAAEHGEPVVAWERGEGDARLVGWSFPNGSSAIETNGDPVFDDGNDSDNFAACWEQRTLSLA